VAIREARVSEFMVIMKPTRRIEEIGGIKYRVWSGQSNTGIRVDMLGLFRVHDTPDKRAEFEIAVCSVDPGDPAPIKLLSTEGLSNP
jgi:hypothetical protein